MTLAIAMIVLGVTFIYAGWTGKSPAALLMGRDEEQPPSEAGAALLGGDTSSSGAAAPGGSGFMAPGPNYGSRVPAVPQVPGRKVQLPGGVQIG